MIAADGQQQAGKWDFAVTTRRKNRPSEAHGERCGLKSGEKPWNEVFPAHLVDMEARACQVDHPLPEEIGLAVLGPSAHVLKRSGSNPCGQSDLARGAFLQILKSFEIVSPKSHANLSCKRDCRVVENVTKVLKQC